MGTTEAVVDDLRSRVDAAAVVTALDPDSILNPGKGFSLEKG
jgi:FAD/FMN-containing dehydrogenase